MNECANVNAKCSVELACVKRLLARKGNCCRQCVGAFAASRAKLARRCCRWSISCGCFALPWLAFKAADAVASEAEAEAEAEVKPVAQFSSIQSTVVTLALH